MSNDDDFCAYHQTSYDNIQKAFGVWKIALDIEWEGYLARISDEEGLGKWAAEVVDYLMQQDDFSK
ncbi:MAG: hypothetical protein ACTSUO_02485 [Candidatus Thorarchaeota archaeon]